jgi:hypothetical protein
MSYQTIPSDAAFKGITPPKAALVVVRVAAGQDMNGANRRASVLSGYVAGTLVASVAVVDYADRESPAHGTITFPVPAGVMWKLDVQGGKPSALQINVYPL